jgi:AAA+ ATPase superfamily predicted ATPase
MAAVLNISDVFRTVGVPTVTYVQRDNGIFESILNGALDERGQLCLITGPSKTGKSTLYREVLTSRKEIPLIIACDKTVKAEQIWRKALEGVDFERAVSRKRGSKREGTIEGEASAKLGWKWLAGVSTKFKGLVRREATEEEVRERIVADASPDLLVPILQGSNYVLVIEDFHYLADEEKVLLFQQWKRFIDNSVTVIVLGTTHRAADIANSNKDLIGRITQIDVGNWKAFDLEKICTQGFKFLKIGLPSSLSELIASEAAGLPIIVQQACLDLFTSQRISLVSDLTNIKPAFDEHSLRASLNNVAKQRYAQMEQYYNILIKGPRERARKYRTYELVLACFTLDPISFRLSRSEIDQRLQRLKISSSEIPPAPSINSTLGALRKYQERRGFELLEWRPNEEALYMLEPVFLFYVRWRKLSITEPRQLELFELLFTNLTKTWKRFSLDAAKK